MLLGQHKKCQIDEVPSQIREKIAFQLINSIPYSNAILQPVLYYRGKSVACMACRRPVSPAWRCRYFPTRTRLPYWRAWSPLTCPCLRTDTCRRWRLYRIESPHLCAPIQTMSLLYWGEKLEWSGPYGTKYPLRQPIQTPKVMSAKPFYLTARRSTTSLRGYNKTLVHHMINLWKFIS